MLDIGFCHVICSALGHCKRGPPYDINKKINQPICHKQKIKTKKVFFFDFSSVKVFGNLYAKK